MTVMAERESVVPTHPHIVFFLVDDMGWNDIGYQSTDIPLATPFMDELASTGVKLDKYYSEMECTPARAALMTGKMPIKLGMQHECITPTSEWGLPTREATMASMLKESGAYLTHIVGKWDLGHYAEELWPTAVRRTPFPPPSHLSQCSFFEAHVLSTPPRRALTAFLPPLLLPFPAPLQRGFDTFYGLACYGYDDYATHSNKGFWDLHDFSAIEGRFEPDRECPSTARLPLAACPPPAANGA